MQVVSLVLSASATVLCNAQRDPHSDSCLQTRSGAPPLGVLTELENGLRASPYGTTLAKNATKLKQVILKSAFGPDNFLPFFHALPFKAGLCLQALPATGQPGLSASRPLGSCALQSTTGFVSPATEHIPSCCWTAGFIAAKNFLCKIKGEKRVPKHTSLHYSVLSIIFIYCFSTEVHRAVYWQNIIIIITMLNGWRGC